MVLCTLSGCGKTPQTEPETTAPQTEAVQAQATEASTPAVYTIRFDKNTTPEDVTDDETYLYDVTDWNADGSQSVTQQQSVVEIPYSEDAYIDQAVPAPQREGYYFAGWQTRPNVGREDLINGVSPYLWMFGTQSRFGDTARVMYIRDLESLTPEGVGTLYARWVKMQDISTEEELQAMGDDLYGAYRLTQNITLTQLWTPIGCYFSNYEYYETGWWTYAFRGLLDGNGHTVSGLRIQGAQLDVAKYKESPTVWFDDGEHANGCAAMFNAIAGAEICNLTLEAPVVDVTGEYAVHGDYLYAGAVAAFDMASNLTQVQVNNPQVKVELSDEASTIRKSLFTAVSGLVGGGWSDNLTDCQVNGGSVTLTMATQASHGGEVYVGGMIGECYSNMTGCTSTADIDCRIADGCKDSQDTNLKVHVGGLNAASTNTTGCTTRNNLNVEVDKPVGEATVDVGGLSGAQRYQTAAGNTVESVITTRCNLDADLGAEHVGAVCGQLDMYYTTQILMYTPVAAAGCTENTTAVTWNGQALTQNMGLVPELDGTPLAWVNKGEYPIAEGYNAPSNIEAVTEKYGSYLPVEYLMDGIIWIVTE